MDSNISNRFYIKQKTNDTKQTFCKRFEVGSTKRETNVRNKTIHERFKITRYMDVRQM